MASRLLEQRNLGPQYSSWSKNKELGSPPQQTAGSNRIPDNYRCQSAMRIMGLEQ